MSMKAHRPVGSAKSAPRIPVSALTTAHLSAVAAFERWQREPPHSDTVTSTEDRQTDHAESDQPLKN
jgi:hypothetical protein